MQRRQVILDDSAGDSRRFLRQLANLHSNEPPDDYALLYSRNVSVRSRDSIAHMVLTVEHDSVHLLFIAPFGNTCSSSMMKLMTRRAFNSASSPVVRKLYVTEESSRNPLWNANSMKLSTGHSFSVMELPESAVSRDWIYHGRDAKNSTSRMAFSTRGPTLASELNGSVGNSESDRESMGKSKSSSLLMQSSQIVEQSIEAKRN